MAEESAANDYAHEPGLSLAETAQRYTEWAKGAKYDKDLRHDNYRGPAITAKILADYFPLGNRDNIVILDVAAGSGFVGEKLRERGFNQIDAVEPSEGMISLARDKRIYSRIFQCFLDGSRLQIASDYYDVAVICGGMGEGHIPCSGLDELVRIVKRGGLIVIVMRENYLFTVPEYVNRLEPHMKELEIQQKWKAVSRTVVPRYSFDNNGIIYIFRVLETQLEVKS